MAQISTRFGTERSNGWAVEVKGADLAWGGYCMPLAYRLFLDSAYAVAHDSHVVVFATKALAREFARQHAKDVSQQVEPVYWREGAVGFQVHRRFQMEDE